jgi:MFS family permease
MNEKHDAYAALAEPDFRRYLTMRFCMVLAGAIQSVCTMWWIYEITKSPLALGLTGLFEAIPAIGLSLYGGHLADKYDRRKIVFACLVFSFLTWCFLATLPFLQEILSKNALIGSIYLVSVLVGVMRAFYSPAAFSFLGQLVSKENLGNAITWNSSAWEVANLGGLAIGGFLYSFLGIHQTFLLVAVLAGIGVLAFSRINSRPIIFAQNAEPALARMKEGLRFVFSNQILIAAIALDMFAVLFGGAVSILPLFAGEILKTGALGLGFLRAAPGIGALLMATYLAYYPMRGNAGRRLLWCVGGFGAAYIAFALSQNFWISMFFLILAGVFDEVSVFIRMTLFQVTPPEHMKGRVSSVNSIFITSSNEIGAFESGLAAAYLGTVPSVVFGGLMTLLVVTITAFKAPKLLNLTFEDLKK